MSECMGAFVFYYPMHGTARITEGGNSLGESMRFGVQTHEDRRYAHSDHTKHRATYWTPAGSIKCGKRVE